MEDKNHALAYRIHLNLCQNRKWAVGCDSRKEQKFLGKSQMKQFVFKQGKLVETDTVEF